jgi:hypothetical protein
MTKVARIVGILLTAPVVLGCAGCLSLVIVTGFLLLSGMNYRPPASPAATAPLASISVKEEDGQPTEIVAYFRDGYRIADSVNLRIFDGVEAYMKPEAVERRLGPPTGHWKTPRPRAPRFKTFFDSQPTDASSPYYDRPDGRLTLRPFPTPEQGLNWVPFALPASCSLEYLFPDVRVRSQLAAVLPAEGSASLSLRGGDGFTGVIVSLNRGGCQDVELAGRVPR